MDIYVLTESDTNHIHYIHASKGVFNTHVNPHLVPAKERGSLIVNPLSIDLSENEIRDQKYP